MDEDADPVGMEGGDAARKLSSLIERLTTWADEMRGWSVGYGGYVETSGGKLLREAAATIERLRQPRSQVCASGSETANRARATRIAARVLEGCADDYVRGGSDAAGAHLVAVAIIEEMLGEAERTP